MNHLRRTHLVFEVPLGGLPLASEKKSASFAAVRPGRVLKSKMTGCSR